jgi:hypothetical protein
MYDSKLISIPVAAAILSKSFDVNKKRNTIIVNFYNLMNENNDNIY